MRDVVCCSSGRHTMYRFVVSKQSLLTVTTDPPFSQGPPMVPAEGGPKNFKLKSSWRQSKILAVSLKHWKGRRGAGGGSRGGSPGRGGGGTTDDLIKGVMYLRCADFAKGAMGDPAHKKDSFNRRWLAADQPQLFAARRPAEVQVYRRPAASVLFSHEGQPCPPLPCLTGVRGCGALYASGAGGVPCKAEPQHLFPSRPTPVSRRKWRTAVVISCCVRLGWSICAFVHLS